MKNELIPKSMYRDLAVHTPLNLALKQFFSEIASIEDCEQLQLSLYQVREYLISQHQDVVQKLRSNEITKALGFRLMQDKASSSGGHFLRWRITIGQTNQSAEKGGLIWKGLVEDRAVSDGIKKRIAQMEKERLVLNMQMSVLNSMMRQLSSTIDKLTEVEAIIQGELSSN
ncbi:DUF3158 family protein [Gallibacterium anatis]|uniref:DUF3158 domain-containing protein n=1 Tax=Gallibacterium anatis 4895 TaxID=1396510 RepID=A0A0A3A3T2_9PAST|nr:DUF3158 family protein [Gallibacterium anatis]KGQ61695.1 hypothetical protein IO48_07295 [Gallibacterium anatis 4895]